MLALHSTWTKPQIQNRGTFGLYDFEILTTILSSLKWREKNGKIKMVTDKIGIEYYKSRNMKVFWDEISTELDSIPETTDASAFWALGKLYAAKSVTAPFAVLDTDFIVWDRIAFDKLGDITAIHREELNPDIYPDKSAFSLSDKYAFNPDFDWSEKPLNTAFYVIKNEKLKEKYINEAVSFAENAKPDNNLTYMVFCEQRLLAMCAKAMNLTPKTFSSLERLFYDGDKYFTHIWGMKEQMKNNETLRRDFCMRMINRLNADFPEYLDIIKSVPELKNYVI